ncbi:hypothetical protein [Parapedobacter tibetensis]|uniref:hypothetical protein n=1 Tax=Parapedobacter tibetensis TaxID=2972951 RepID=UPI00214D5C9E|nr:hypothetical protein [Parapedobacter tibetensis]
MSEQILRAKEKLLVQSFLKNGFFKMENIEPEKLIKMPCLSIGLTAIYGAKKPE